MIARSMSYGEGNGLKILFEGTQHKDPRVVEASLKAIKNVLDCVEISRELIFKERWIHLLIGFISLDHYSPKIVEMAIKLVARCCEEHNVPNIGYQKIIAKTGIINQLVGLLLFSGMANVSERDPIENQSVQPKYFLFYSLPFY